MFEFGGSTIVMLFKEGAADIDRTVFNNTRRGRETIVKMGETVGQGKKKN
jgi:phosphatidylserine decarboxylase